jgi:hypothetical protein
MGAEDSTMESYHRKASLRQGRSSRNENKGASQVKTWRQAFQAASAKGLRPE